MRERPKPTSCASALYVNAEFSVELDRLLNERLMRGQCVECGGRPIKLAPLCGSCWSEYPKITDIGEPDGVWQRRVRQTKPAYLGGAFWAEQNGIFEREGRSRFIGLFDSFDEARQAVVKNLERSIRAAEIGWRAF
jgi:hypothetical protein